MNWWQAYSWKEWVSIWESHSEEGLRKWRWQLYDLHGDSEVGSEARKFVKDALSEMARIDRRRELHWLLRDQLMASRPDLSGDVLIEAMVEIERMRLDLEGPGGFETDFTSALEVAETRAEAVRKERGGS